MTMNQSLRVAVAGAGKMALQHIRAIQALGPQAEVVGIADPSKEACEAALAQVPNAISAPGLSELLGQVQVDVVHVCTPMELHATIAMEALEHGCHVYIEKPVTPGILELEPLLGAAEQRSLKICAGHQVLFERPYQRMLELLPAIGSPVHVESYFSFRPVRTSSGNKRPLTNEEQLVDVLPHPVYLMLDVLERARPQDNSELRALEISPGRTVHALVGRGSLNASLMASLEARPVEHWLKVVGTNGTIHADFVRGSVQELLGPGTSGFDKALNPFRLSSQLGLRNVAALARRIRKRGGGYPGLEEIFQAFYRSIIEELPSPTSPTQIRGTVQICDEVRTRLQEDEAGGSRQAVPIQAEAQVLVTGGTGMLGREVVKLLREAAFGVRVVSRRIPPTDKRLSGVEYVSADLAESLAEELLSGIQSVIHCAAETSGGWDAHQRNSIDATVSVLRAAADAGVSTFVHVSSVAVLDSTRKGPITDETPLHPDPKSLGPYAWGKLESERLARELAPELGITLKVVRPVALVDPSAFAPPGRLGRRLGNLFVAVGWPSKSLAAASNVSSARGVVAAAIRPGDTQDVMNLVPRESPTRGELVERLRQTSPEVSVVWLPRVLLYPLSWTATLAQKVLRPGKPAMNVASAFAGTDYEPGSAARWMSEDEAIIEPAREAAHAP